MNLELTIEKFKEFASSHAIINDFRDKPIEDFKAANLKYPLMWTQFNSSQLRQGRIMFNFSIYFMDKSDINLDNNTSILSDMIQVSNDFYTNFIDYNMGVITINEEPTATPVISTYDDIVTGIQLDVNIEVPYCRAKNNIPLK